ncbi:MAG: hypothetical protein AAB250_05410 [Bdellovibrionota bacterium]
MKIFGPIAAALIAVGAAQAQATIGFDVGQLQVQALVEAQATQGLNWKVGDQADYSVDIGGFIKGTSHNFVREDTGTELWMVQDMDLGFAGKQKVEVLFDKATGQIKKMLANGQEQEIPDNKDVEIVEMKEDHLKVAAGEFDCIYAKIKNKKDGSIQEAWINPQEVPMSGLLKALADSQFGKVVQELNKFQRAP